ncbi:MAG TPA: redoxin domain-containing protein [Flavihumibacter sp.]|nr:TlpA family protein disulfide reductase [Bacteroidota bacterium]HOA37387.1 redoxin domain-containing protein [Flavihumibacter sp.]HPZ87694.1 redoxin domain-containing protein [Flavihumibacter sp.]HQD10107.1 redoxin domain-containing protein [Flavihumibacter sp.]
MRRFLIICFFVALAQVAGAQEIKKCSIAELEQYISSSSKPLVINFWASFCKPCLEELPALLAGARQYPNLELVLVSLDLPDYYPDRLKIFVGKHNLQAATHYWLNETDADLFCPRIDKSWSGAIPVTLFINPATNYRQFMARMMTTAEIQASFLALDATTH